MRPSSESLIVRFTIWALSPSESWRLCASSFPCVVPPLAVNKEIPDHYSMILRSPLYRQVYLLNDYWSVNSHATFTVQGRLNCESRARSCRKGYHTGFGQTVTQCLYVEGLWHPKCTKTFRTFSGVECVSWAYSLSERARFDKVRADPGLRVFFVQFGWLKESRTLSSVFPTVPKANRPGYRLSHTLTYTSALPTSFLSFPNHFLRQFNCHRFKDPQTTAALSYRDNNFKNFD